MAVTQGIQRARNWSGSCSSGSWGNWSTTSQSTYESYSIVESVSRSSSGPGWRRARNAGGILPVNPYSISKIETFRKGTNGKTVVVGACPSREVENQDLYYTGFESLPSGWKVPDPTSGDVAGAVNSAISDSSAGVMQLGVTALEAKETWQLLKGAVPRLKAIWKKCVYDAPRRGVSPQTLWLEYRYGWQPIYFELRAAVAAFNGKFYEGMRQHGTGRRELTDSKQQTVVTNLGTLSRTVSYSLDWKIRISGFALSQVESQTMAKYGLNPVTTIWEKVTYSFMIDWIWDIGSWLSNLSLGLSGYKLVSSGHSIKTTAETRITVNFTGIGSTTGSYSGQEYKVKRVSFTRNPGGGGGLPSLNLHLSGIHLADLLAIIGR